MTYQVTPGWLTYHPESVHARVQGSAGIASTRTATCSVPATRFPYAPERKYTPVDASKEQLFALRDRLGFDKNVIVQATCHGTDNRALVDALRASNNRARGVATVDRSISDERAARAARRRRARHAIQLRQAARRLHAARGARPRSRTASRRSDGTS